MMIPLERAILEYEHRIRRPGRLRELCGEVFGSPEGAELLALLCTVEHPMDHTYEVDARAAAHAAGRREVIAMLWRHGSSLNFVPPPQEEGGE